MPGQADVRYVGTYSQRPYVERRNVLRVFLALTLMLTLLAGCMDQNQSLTSTARTGSSSTASLPTPNASRDATSVDPTPTAAELNTPVSTPEPSPVSVTATSQHAAATAAAASSAGSAKTESLPQAIDALLAGVPAHIGMVIALKDGTPLYQTEADTLFESASLYKLGIMVEVYQQRDAGKLSFDDPVTLYPGFFLESDSVYSYDNNTYDQVPVGTLLTDMITLSSNVAATALLYLVGTDEVNSTMESLGLEHTKILWYPVAEITSPTWTTRPVSTAAYTRSMPLVFTELETIQSSGGIGFSVDGAYNVTTPGDISHLFLELLNGRVISPETSVEMLNLLTRQQINDRLPAGLPDDTHVAHKTGDLDSSVHDAGVIYAPDGPIVVAILSDEVQDRQAVVVFMQKVARLAYQSVSP